MLVKGRPGCHMHLYLRQDCVPILSKPLESLSFLLCKTGMMIIEFTSEGWNED